MYAVQFGAGNIGRGFVAKLLYESGYHTIFVDIDEQLIDKIHTEKQYDVVIADESMNRITVENISGINSLSSPQEVIDVIVKADVLTTAVGPVNLENIAPIIAKGLQVRFQKNDKILHVIACENMINGSTTLKHQINKYLFEKEKVLLEERVVFLNTAIDRIVPNQQDKRSLNVLVEPYYEWIIENKDLQDNVPFIHGVKYVQKLKPYIERKLYTVNTGHAATAYLGHLFGFQTIHQAILHEETKEIVYGALRESGKVLVHKYGFSQEEHSRYINQIINRFMNSHISDDVVRVGRDPLRKLAFDDRFVQPAYQYMKLFKNQPIFLAKAIAAALQFNDDRNDEAIQLQSKIKANGYRHTIVNVCGLEKNSKLVNTILNVMKDLEQNGYII